MSSPTSKDPLIIRKLKAILDANLGNEGFGVKELAREVGLSRSSLHRKVHAYNGNSTTQFIREYRLQKAMEMLLEGEETVSEIAYQVGFSSPTYFNTCFKDYYGYPPGEAKVRRDGLYEQVDASAVTDNNEDSFALLNKLRFTKRWAVILSIGIGVLISWATIYYLGVNKGAKVTSTANLKIENSMAVLPFKNWSGDPLLEYRSDGMTNAVLTRLSFVENLRVVPFTSVLKYKSSDKDAPSIARELGVQYILQGSLELSGDKVKFTLDLIDGPSNTLISSKDYIGAWQEDIFAMQATVVEDLISQMHIDVSSEELSAIERNPTKNKEAYNNWLKGQYQLYKYTKEGLTNSLPLFQEAIRLDSTFVEPYVEIAQLYLLGGASWGLYSERESWRIAKEFLLKAIEIDDTYQRAKALLNDGLYMYEWDFVSMEKNYRTNSNFNVSYCLQTGRFKEAYANIIENLERNPTSTYNIAVQASALYFLGRKSEAMELMKKTDKLYSDDILYLRNSARFYYYMEEYDRSYMLLNRITNNFQEEYPWIYWLGAVHAARNGNRTLRDHYLEKLHEKYETSGSGSPAWFTALYYGCVGDYENALLWLEKSYERHEVEMIWLREEPTLKPLRSDPRYLELYQKVGFPMPPYPK